MRLVLDNSVTVGWVHPDQATAYSTALLDAHGRYEPLAPTIWPLEFANALLLLQRRKRIGEADRIAAIARAESWKFTVDASAPRMGAISALAIEHGLTTYDAAYLDCAVRHRAKLATQDIALTKAARKLDCWYQTP